MSGSRPAIRLAVAVVAALVFSFGTASARLPKPPVCRDGRFVTAPGAPPLLAGATVTVPEAGVVEGGTSTIAIAGHCPAVQVPPRGTSRGTKGSASWPESARGPADGPVT